VRLKRSAAVAQPAGQATLSELHCATRQSYLRA
jgi:hypothetical protein